ncbi:type II secretion system F family protein [Candidatus Micrarchaeota archaeon]|nr:type II secretion system F family protein [Candidatus Micrarchaeota archaeon]
MANTDIIQLKIDEMQRYYAATGFKVSFLLFVAMIFFFATLVATVMLLFFNDVLTAFVAFIAVLTLAVVIPVSIRGNRIEAIEGNLPDALKHMSSILRAGGTTEDALEEVANSDYGPLSTELKVALIQLKEGKPFDDVLYDAAMDSGSELFRRTVTIIIDAKRAGAGLADVMDAIAEDARDLIRIQRERMSRTTMPVLFLYISSLFLAPFIFGFTLTIVIFIGCGLQEALGGQTMAVGALKTLIVAFIALQTTIAALAIGIIREGKALKYVMRAPFMILISLVSYNVGFIIGGMLIGTTGGSCV